MNFPEEIAVPKSPRVDSVNDLHVGTCNHDKESGRFVSVIRNVGYEEINPFLLTLAYDAQCGAGLLYCYPYGEGSDNETDREVSLDDLVVGESDPVWLFSGHRLKAGRGQGMQRKKVGICPFCCKDAVLLKAATAPVVRNKNEVLSERLRKKMNKNNTQLAVLENLIMLAPYYASYKNKDSSKIEHYIDLYPSLWSSAGRNYLKYKKVDPLVKINLGLNCDLKDLESEKLIESLDDLPMVEGERPKDVELSEPRMVDDETKGNIQIPIDQRINDSSVKNSGEMIGRNEREFSVEMEIDNEDEDILSVNGNLKPVRGEDLKWSKEDLEQLDYSKYEVKDAFVKFRGNLVIPPLTAKTVLKRLHDRRHNGVKN